MWKIFYGGLFHNKEDVQLLWQFFYIRHHVRLGAAAEMEALKPILSFLIKNCRHILSLYSSKSLYLSSLQSLCIVVENWLLVEVAQFNKVEYIITHHGYQT